MSRSRRRSSTADPAPADPALPLGDADVAAPHPAGSEGTPGVGVPHYAGHRARLRERFLANPEGLPDYELLELVLCLAQPRGDVKPLAKALLQRFGSFAEVIAAEPARLRDIKGLGDTGLAALKTVEAAAVRLLRDPVRDTPVLSSWDRLLDYCRAAMAYRAVEQFRILFLDTRNRLIADELQQKGTVNHTPVYPREVVRRALELHASSLILVHNHPSGDPSPSKADIQMTLQVRNAAHAVGVTLHDHVIVGRGGHVSFKAQGLL
ncbi:JAB domain-containing protein [Roseospira marina]|uniref:JAB domain-containing protein n=1 Tax=Roseospira marina TaxID=140057 RepID=A0A5M6IAA0_9PROT|nr:DNA repair protein RadC [Roseospira marina]KAA5604655.1 JAB domain-containing protein [Roseospira marina]MBB4315099.1 DNA repair protein RadC [Roseospira marina]MBB5088131.1 DNA repair protein RadC [Roseospira marina]